MTTEDMSLRLLKCMCSNDLRGSLERRSYVIMGELNHQQKQPRKYSISGVHEEDEDVAVLVMAVALFLHENIMLISYILRGNHMKREAAAAGNEVTTFNRLRTLSLPGNEYFIILCSEDLVTRVTFYWNYCRRNFKTKTIGIFFNIKQEYIFS